MIDQLLLTNPYQTLYQQHRSAQKAHLSKGEVQNLIRHLGMIYNTFGAAIKDFIKVVSPKFANDTKQTTPPPPLQTKSRLISQTILNEKRLHVDNISTQQPKPPSRRSRQSKARQSKNMKNSIKTIYQQKEPFKNGSLDLQSGNEVNEHSQFSLFSLPEEKHKENISKNVSQNNLLHFHSQFFKVQSPNIEKKIEQNLDNYHYQLSHKQKLPQFDESFTKGRKSFNQVHNIEKESVRSQQVKELTFAQMMDRERAANNNVRIAGARKKKDRQNLMGVTCLQCEKYYKAMQIKGQQLCNCTSRHRSNLPTRKIKNHFTQQFDL